MLQRALEACAGLALGAVGAAIAAQAGSTIGTKEPAASPLPGRPAASTARESSETAAPPEPVASYTLSARLDEQAHTVSGRGTIRWRNATRAPADEIWVHLYLNAF